MVENRDGFCLPHNFSYEGGSYQVRHFYPRLICCRHGRSTENVPGSSSGGMTSPAGESGSEGALSPVDGSPQHRKPLLVTHVEGAAVVSKIAVPHGRTTPLTCPTNSSSGGISLRGMGLGPEATNVSCTVKRSPRRGGGPTATGGGNKGRAERQGVVVVEQPARIAASQAMFTPGTRAVNHQHHHGGVGLPAGGGVVGCRASSATSAQATPVHLQEQQQLQHGAKPADSAATVSHHSYTSSRAVRSPPIPIVGSSPTHHCLISNVDVQHYLVPVQGGGGDQQIQECTVMGDGQDTQARAPGGGVGVGGTAEDPGGGSEGAVSPVASTPGSMVEGQKDFDNEQQDGGRVAVFRLSDASDYSDDYTAMTEVSVDGGSVLYHNDVEEEEEDQGVNGSSSLCTSDVFSDRSSDPGPEITQDVDNVDDEEEEDDLDTPNVFAARLVANSDSPTRKTLLLQGQVQTFTSADLQTDGDQESVKSPDITLEEVFDLQRDNLELIPAPGGGDEEIIDDDDQAKSGFYEDREFEFLKAQPIKRSTSLKTYKTPPGTPKRKMVRFADALGLDLESVRHILNLEAPPRVPASAMRDLKLEDESSSNDPRFKGSRSNTAAQGARYLTACFAQPGINPTFPLLVRDKKVMLESCVINDHNLSITGTVRVANIHYHKLVTVRYTTNNWLTFNDITAGYVANSNDGPTDRFSFSICLPHYFSTGSRLEFCVQFVASGQEFWDNNHGRNYIIECYARALPESDNTWMSFL